MDLIIKVYRKAKRCSNATDIKQEGGGFSMAIGSHPGPRGGSVLKDEEMGLM